MCGAWNPSTTGLGNLVPLVGATDTAARSARRGNAAVDPSLNVIVGELGSSVPYLTDLLLRVGVTRGVVEQRCPGRRRDDRLPRSIVLAILREMIRHNFVAHGTVRFSELHSPTYIRCQRPDARLITDRKAWRGQGTADIALIRHGIELSRARAEQQHAANKT